MGYELTTFLLMSEDIIFFDWVYLTYLTKKEVVVVV